MLVSRRRFVQGAGVAGLGVLAGCGRVASQGPAPPTQKVYCVGILRGNTPAANDQELTLLRQALGELGYVEGRNLVLEYRWNADYGERLTAQAAELVGLPVDLLVALSAPGAAVARQVTTTVPIIQAGPGDPLERGLAESYAHPGTNVTGVMNLARPLNSKRLQLLKEAAPVIARVAVFWDTPVLGPFAAEAWAHDAETIGVAVHPLEPSNGDDEVLFASAAREGTDALLVASSALAQAHRPQILRLTAQLRWPAMYFHRAWVEEGGLMSYDANEADLYRRAASHVDKVLRGERPADIPIEQPMRFDFFLNQQTAQTIGLTLPQSVLLQATEVLQ
jgi:putative tryptophan/tyrosine transport system substrate-binding protein